MARVRPVSDPARAIEPGNSCVALGVFYLKVGAHGQPAWSRPGLGQLVFSIDPQWLNGPVPPWIDPMVAAFLDLHGPYLTDALELSASRHRQLLGNGLNAKLPSGPSADAAPIADGFHQPPTAEYANVELDLRRTREAIQPRLRIRCCPFLPSHCSSPLCHSTHHQRQSATPIRTRDWPRNSLRDLRSLSAPD